MFAFTGEALDSSGLIYLRARYYAPGQGRFISRDVWVGDYYQPILYNRWLYANANPINNVDPSGFFPWNSNDVKEADRIIGDLKSKYGVKIDKDYRWVASGAGGYGQCSTQVWSGGNWTTIDQLKLTEKAIQDVAAKMGSGDKFKKAMHNRDVWIIRRNIPGSWPGPITAFAPPAEANLGDVDLPNYIFENGDVYAEYTIIHELGHVWDRRSSLELSSDLMIKMGTLVCSGMGGCYFDITAGQEPPPGNPKNPYAGKNAMEDWAEAFATYIYPNYYAQFSSFNTLGKGRWDYVDQAIKAIK